MKAFTDLLQRFDSQQARNEIDDELRLHLDLLTDELCRQDMSRDEARVRAETRFGSVDRIRDQCVEIRIRNNPMTRACKSFLILVFLMGILVRVLGTEYHVTRVGGLLIMVGLLGHLLLYVRGLNPSRFFSKPDASSQLILNERGQVSVTGFDQSGRTPLERLISEK